jgi:hypothetical protein
MRRPNLYWVTCFILFSSVLNGCINGSDGNADEETQIEESGRIQLLKNWIWDVDRPFETTDLLGRMMITSGSHSNSLYSSVNTIIERGSYPRFIKLLLPLNEQFSGTVSVALDPTSDPASISVDGWLRTKRSWGGYQSFSDENPFSSAQLLFSTGRYNSLIDGSLTPRDFELYVIPDALPPYLFSKVDGLRFIVNLPPISEVNQLNVMLWRDLNEEIKLAKAQVSLWRDHQLVSTISESNLAGEAKLNIWNDQLSNDMSGSLSIRVTPPEDSRLPQMSKTFTAAELLSDSVEIALPYIGELIEVPISIEANAVDGGEEIEEVWRLFINQSWSGEREQNYALPNEFDERRSSAWWRSVMPIIPNGSNQVKLYNTGGIIFVNPPAQSSKRTQRIEVGLLNTANSLRLSSLPKPQVRGQLRDEDGRSIEAKITFTQLAWPWVDAKELPLGEFISQTDSQGGFSIAVDPGVYAVSYIPYSNEYAPRVIVLKVPEGEGLLISPQQALMLKGREIDIRVGGDAGGITSVEARLNIHCLVSYKDDLFLGSSQRDDQRPHLKISLYQTSLGIDEILKINLDPESCPPWLIDIND